MKLSLNTVILIVGLSVAGCGGESGPERVSVSGRVAIDGTPITQGAIAFVSLNGGRTSAGAIVNGVYNISRNDGPCVGEQKVTVQAFEKTGKILDVKKTLPGPPDEEPAIPEGGIKIEETKQVLPARYNTKSVLRATLESGTNGDVNFDLTLSGDSAESK